MSADDADAADAAELRAVAERYARRVDTGLYSPLRPEVRLAMHERQAALLGLLARHAPRPLAELDLIEVGCGHGDNLIELMRLGFDPARLVGNELLPARLDAARRRLPAATTLLAGDASRLAVAPASFDLVLQSTVFSSLLDDAFQQRLAAAMWSWLRPGGAVLWYDFTVDNPRNPDVRGVPPARLRVLFPQGLVQSRRVTLAPPLARALCRVHPRLYGVFNSVPLLRTHLFAWIGKPT